MRVGALTFDARGGSPVDSYGAAARSVEGGYCALVWGWVEEREWGGREVEEREWGGVEEMEWGGVLGEKKRGGVLGGGS